MNDYFDQLEWELRDAVAKRRHLPWYTRVRLPRRGRGLLLVLAGLVVATPAAVGAASGWFSAGQPVKSPPVSAIRGDGKVLPGGSRLLPIRVADPAGGPRWGLRLVRTTRGDSCIQIGRVQGGQIGSLGIDNAFDNDHQFHAISPNDTNADLCGATDGVGVGFVNADAHDTPASVNVPIGNGTETASPQSGMRMIFAGLLGPQAKSITYRTPSGQTLTQPTVGRFGAYLIVFRQTFANCFAFETGAPGRICGAMSHYSSEVEAPTAIMGITYKDGTICRVSLVPNGPGCQPVGFVAVKHRNLTSGDVTSPITVHVAWPSRVHFKKGLIGAPAAQMIKVSFTAREPVARSDSNYQLTLRTRGAQTGGLVTETNANIHRGQRVTLTMPLPAWNGGWSGTVTFRQDIGQAGERALTVGSFRLPPAKK